MSSMIQSFRRNPRLVTRQVLFLQQPKISLRNSNLHMFQPSLSSHHTISSNNPNKWKSAWKEKLASVQTYLYSINWKQRMSELWGLLWKGGTIFLAGDLIYLGWINQTNERRVNKTLERGTQPEEKVSKDKFIPRSDVVKRLKEIFQPGKDHSYYHVVCGEHGTGKTTLTTKVAREVGKGVIYVDIPADIEEFGKSFGKAINFIFDEDTMLTLRLKRKFFGDARNPKWKRALSAFEYASEVYKAKHNKPPVIVYDNVSRLIHENPRILDILQDDAKDNADDSKYIAVFVSSEGSVPRRMESRSAWSRADKPVMEIGDLSKEESMKYLIEKRKVKEEEAKRLYELVGGRIVDLKSVADKFLAKQPFEVIKQQVFGSVFDNLEAAEMNPGQSNHEAAKIIIKALINSNDMLHVSKLREMTKVEPSKLLKNNVFAYHPENKAVTFQSRSTECYIRENEKFIN